MSAISLPDVRKELRRCTHEIDVMISSTHKLTHDELTELRDSLNFCAETVQTIRDMIVFKD